MMPRAYRGTSNVCARPSARRMFGAAPMENQTGPRSPHLLLIAEPNGSGKTTVTRRMVDLSSFPKARVIDPDALAAALPGNFCKAGNAGRAALVAGRLRYRALADRQDILWQAVFAARGDATRFARAAKNAGYVTHLIFKLPRATRPSTPIAWLGAIWRAGTLSLWTSSLIAIIALWATCHDRSGTSIWCRGSGTFGVIRGQARRASLLWRHAP